MGLRFGLFTVLLACPTIATAQGPGLDLYRRLATTPLDEQRVFHIRDCDLDLEDLHLTLSEGTVLFLKEVDGRTTGALFVGEGSVLVIPPNQVERASLTRFTKSAVLNERIHSAYLRFYDDATLASLKAALRGPEPNSAELAKNWDPLAKTLASADALRLTMLVLNQRPIRYVRAHIGGDHLGVFDTFYDQSAPESVLVVQAGTYAGKDFQDVWLSFPAKSMRPQRAAGATHDTEQVSDTDQLQADQNGLISNLDILHYDIAVDVAPPTSISAAAKLQVRSREGPVTAAVFQLSRKLKVSSVKLDGAPVEFLQNPPIAGTQTDRSGNDLVAVVLPAPLQPGAQHLLEFSYAGAVMTDTGGGLLYVGDHGTWYPNFGFRNAMYELRYRVPSGWSLVSTGQPVGDRKDLHFITAKPVPIAGFNVGRFTETRFTPASGGVSIAALATERIVDEHDTDRIASRASATVAFLEKHLGSFPYRQLSISEVPGGVSQGWPSLVYLSTQAFNAPKLGAQPRTEFARIVFEDLMMPHEIGHQYWGDNVSWRSYREQWIMEALANYCSLMMIEDNSANETREVLEHYRQGLLRAGTPVAPVTLGQRLDSSQAPEGYTLLTYGRGTWLIHMLRTMFRDAEVLGGKGGNPDEPFWTALRDLQSRYAGKSIGEGELRQAFERVLPPRLKEQSSDALAWFFSDWVNGSAVPHFALEEVRITATAASGKIVTTQAPTDFTALLPLYALKQDGSRQLVAQVVADEAEISFKIKVPAGTSKLVLDPDHEVLRRD
ncbi:MAG: hypothetical protein NVS9B15_05100 [Acidobacteriaceae bacterium]